MFLILILISVIMLSVWMYYYNTYWTKKNVRSIRESSILNSLYVLFLRKSIFGYIEELYMKYNDKYVGFFMLNTPSLFVKDVNLIRRILLKDFLYFPDRTIGRNPDADKLGAHILFLTRGQEWKFMRTKVVPAYSPARINSQIPLIEEVCECMQDYLERRSNQIVDIREIAAKYSTDVITTSAYGINGRSFTEAKDSFRATTIKMFPATLSRALQFSTAYVAPFLLKYLSMTFLDKDANKRLENTYIEQMKMKRETGIHRNDFLDFIIELCKKETDPRFNIDHRAMVSQAAQYFMAGFETIGSIFAYVLYELAKHPDVQTRLREEIKSVMDNQKTLTPASIKELDYLDMVFRETLRLYPVLPFLDRKAAKDYKIPDTDIIIEKGTNVYMSSIGMHFDPQYFPNPHKFDPERFSPENRTKIDPFTYLPFGAGPRMCIGARYGIVTIKTGIVHLVSKFNVSTCPDTVQKLNYLPGSFILVPDTKVNVVFSKI